MRSFTKTAREILGLDQRGIDDALTSSLLNIFFDISMAGRGTRYCTSTREFSHGTSHAAEMFERHTRDFLKIVTMNTMK